MESFNRIALNVRMGEDVKVYAFVSLYGCTVGDRTKLGTFVEIQKNATVGCDCKISSHSFVCEGVVIRNGVFLRHGVIFINDKYPRAINEDGSMQTESDWCVVPTYVEDYASIGSGVTIMCGVRIGHGAIVGSGSVVRRSIPAGEIWAGNPARFIRKVDHDPSTISRLESATRAS